MTPRSDPSKSTDPQPEPPSPAEQSSQRSTATAASEPASLAVRALQALPTALVLVALAAIGYWGHHSGWTIPRFSSLLQSAAPQEPAWCSSHGVPEAICVSCNADLMPKGELRGWCREHGVAECPLCNPELAQLKKLSPATPADLDRATRALRLRPRPENNSRCKLHLRRIQFVSAEAIEKAGIDVNSVVQRAPIVESILASGEITYDQTRVARLSARVPGTIWRVDKQVGDRVTRGEILTLIDAAAVGQAKGDLLRALGQMTFQSANYKRLASIGGGAVAARRVQEAATALRDAKVRLLAAQQALTNLGLPVDVKQLTQLSEEALAQHIRLLGLPKGFAEQVGIENVTANLLPLTAPLDGVVVTREVVAGEVVDTTKALFTVADNSSMWVSLDVRLEDAKYLALGQTVRFRPDGDLREVIGKLSWISTSVDRQTRTVKARAALVNPTGQLRDETFGSGRIILREESDAIVVPNESVHWEGCCHIVFIRDKTYFDEGSYKLFHTRCVRPGVKTDRYTEMLAGVLPGEVIVTKGSGVLRAELLKGNLGPG